MAAQKGKDILIKIGDGGSPESFTTVAGIRTRTFSLNAKTVDVTDADSAGGWRELLDGAAVRQMSVSGAGVFRSEAADATMRQAFFSGAASPFQLVAPGFGTFAGPFQVTTLEYAGSFDGEATYALTLASAGALTFTAGAGPRRPTARGARWCGRWLASPAACA